jgi:hypothetical protein
MAHGHGGKGNQIARYLAVLKNDPFYRQSVADVHAANAADSAQLGSGIMSALAARGSVPDLQAVAGQLGLSPQVIKWIMSNVDLGHASALASEGNAAGTTTQAQLDLAHNTNLENIGDSLAARGMLQSGATPQEEGAEAQNYKLGNFNADQALASYLNGAFSSFAAAKQKNALGLNTALQQAYQRALQFYGTNPPPPVHNAGGQGNGNGNGGGLVVHKPIIRAPRTPHFAPPPHIRTAYPGGLPGGAGTPN